MNPAGRSECCCADDDFKDNGLDIMVVSVSEAGAKRGRARNAVLEEIDWVLDQSNMQRQQEMQLEARELLLKSYQSYLPITLEGIISRISI